MPDPRHAGAGIIPFCPSTGRFLLDIRSRGVTEPGTVGIWGGKIEEGQDSESAARTELFEETGHCHAGPLTELCVYVSPSRDFTYTTYLAEVEDEFEPVLGWESDDAVWALPGDFPGPLHFGVEFMLAATGDKLVAMSLAARGITLPENPAP
jgi:8-oxo-dGTP pyrophosphatase MutT (NUDIX family)